MTIRTMVSEVLDNLERFPKGWGTEVKDYFKAIGKDHLEKKQKWVWKLTIRTPYNGEADAVSVYRTRAKAIAAMEEDIRETLASPSPRFDPECLVREGDASAHHGDEVFWDVERVELFD